MRNAISAEEPAKNEILLDPEVIDRVSDTGHESDELLDEEGLLDPNLSMPAAFETTKYLLKQLHGAGSLELISLLAMSFVHTNALRKKIRELESRLETERMYAQHAAELRDDG